MITINRIIPQKVAVFKDGEYWADVNEYEFNDLRLQIKREKAEGWSVEFDDVMIPIEPDGYLYYRPAGLFDLISDQLLEMITGETNLH